MQIAWQGPIADVASLSEDPDYRAIVEWFAERGFGVAFTADEDEHQDQFVWADLTSLPSGRIAAPKYGRGRTEVLAARSAKERYEEEQ